MTRISESKGGLTHSELIKYLHYDHTTGIFTRIAYTDGRVSKKAPLRSPTPLGYLRLCLLKKYYYCHRLAWFYVYGMWPREEIDHINNDPSDNRIANLREATRSENTFNMRRRPDNMTGFIGVCFNKRAGKYKARHNINGREIHLGYFSTAEEASAAYQAAIIYRGEFTYREFHE